MKRKTLIVFVVLIAVVTTLYVFAQNPPMGRGEGPRGKTMQMRDFIDDLDLTPEQQAKMVDLRFAHRQELLPLERDLQKKRIELENELSKENPNLQIVDKLSDEISAIKAKIKKSRLHFLLSLKSVLTPEQWQKAKEQFIEREGGRFQFGERRGLRRGECRMEPTDNEMMPPPPPPRN